MIIVEKRIILSDLDVLELESQTLTYALSYQGVIGKQYERDVINGDVFMLYSQSDNEYFYFLGEHDLRVFEFPSDDTYEAITNTDWQSTIPLSAIRLRSAPRFYHMYNNSLYEFIPPAYTRDKYVEPLKDGDILPFCIDGDFGFGLKTPNNIHPGEIRVAASLTSFNRFDHTSSYNGALYLCVSDNDPLLLEETVYHSSFNSRTGVNDILLLLGEDNLINRIPHPAVVSAEDDTITIDFSVFNNFYGNREIILKGKSEAPFTNYHYSGNPRRNRYLETVSNQYPVIDLFGVATSWLTGKQYQLNGYTGFMLNPKTFSFGYEDWQEYTYQVFRSTTRSPQLSFDLGDTFIFDDIGGDFVGSKLRKGVIVTYGVDEQKYEKNRDIRLTPYLPVHFQDTQIKEVLSVFETYMNNMFNDAENKTWSSDDIDVTRTISNDVFDAVENEYELDNVLFKTYADEASSRYIDSVCDESSGKISILDKIQRLTELHDPELIPIDLIQHYAENIGYTDGFSRTSLSNRTNHIEQKRYLRFMIANLPNWYQIKTTRSSVALMLYSFGLNGNFVYYYTRNYSDLKNSTVVGATGNEDDVDIGVCGLEYPTVVDKPTMYDISKIREYLSVYTYDTTLFVDKTNTLFGGYSKDWITTGINPDSINEDLTPVIDAEQSMPGYYSTPHFKLIVEYDEESKSYSIDTNKQREIKKSVEMVRPINTVFDGVGLHYSVSDTLLIESKVRLRKYIKYTVE